MNSHFQSRATTSTVIGCASAGIGRLASSRVSCRYGSSVWVLIQVTAPSAMMMSSGAPQIASSSCTEWSQLGEYSFFAVSLPCR